MQVGVEHPVSLAAFSVVVSSFSVVVSRPSRAVGRYLVPRITRRTGRPTGVGIPARPTARAGRPHGGRPYRAALKPRDLALCSGPSACCRCGFACYVWDPATTAGAAGGGSGHAPAGFAGRMLAGLPGRRPGRPGLVFPAVAPAGKPSPGRPVPQPGPGVGRFFDSACSSRPWRRRLPGSRAPGPLQAVRSLPAPATGRAQPASHWV